MSADRIRPRRVCATPLAVTTALLAALGSVGCSAEAPPDGSKGAASNAAITEMPRGFTRLARGLHPAAREELDRGPLEPTTRISNLSLVLKLSDAQIADREALKAALVDPRSPQFRKFLSTAEYAARFGAPRATVERAKTWLASQGLEVHDDSPLGARVTFSGSVDQIQTAFRTEMRRYELGGRMHYAMRTAPGLPADLAEVTAEMTNTHDFHPRPLHVRPPAPDYQGGSASGFAAPDWANVYDVAPVYTTGVGGHTIDGTGVTIAVVGVAQIAQSDIDAWRSKFDLGTAPAPVTMTLVPNSGPSMAGQGGAGFEAVLDVEWTSGIAKGAKVNYVYVGSTDQNVDDATYYAIENNLGSVINESFGGCEGFYVQAGYGPGDQNVIDVYGSAANVLGITYVAASGDSGAAGCIDEMVAGLYVNVPAAYPGVTAVGGTQFPKSALSGTPYYTTYSTSEAVWDQSGNPKTGVGASGGGISVLFDRPSYQSGIPTCAITGSLPVSGVTPANQRQVPDVSFNAASGGNVIADLMMCTIDGSTGDCAAIGGSASLNGGGGTSFAAPAFSGVVALMNQAAGGRLGNINPMLYGLAVTTPTAFHDITKGNNDVQCGASDPGCGTNSYGFSSTAGYDCATGLGSMDVYNAMSAIASQAGTTTALAIAPTSTTEGTPVSFTATVAVPAPNAQSLGGLVTFAFLSYDQSSQVDLSWTLGTGTITGGTTAGGTATFTGAVPPGLVKPGMQSVDLIAMYGGDPAHLPSTSAKVTLSFGPLAFAIQPAMPTIGVNGTISFTSTGGVSPVKWYTGSDTTCDTSNPPNCSTIDETTGAFKAGPVVGTTFVQALDADGAEVDVTVNVTCNALTTCPAGMNCGTISDGCDGMITCGTCTAPQTCGSNNACGCTPATACAAGDQCGMASDGCGGMISCGTCSSDQTCSANQCVPAASGATTTAASSGATTSSSSSSGSGTGGSPPTTSASESSSSTSGGPAAAKSGCSCEAAGDPADAPNGGMAALGVLALAGMLRSRRRD